MKSKKTQLKHLRKSARDSLVTLQPARDNSKKFRASFLYFEGYLDLFTTIESLLNVCILATQGDGFCPPHIKEHERPASARLYRVPFRLNHNSEIPQYHPIILFPLHNLHIFLSSRLFSFWHELLPSRQRTTVISKSPNLPLQRIFYPPPIEAKYISLYQPVCASY